MPNDAETPLQLWKGLYAIGGAIVAAVGAGPVFLAWKANAGTPITWGEAAVAVTLMFFSFVGTPWITWLFARRWATWKFEQVRRVQEEFETAARAEIQEGLAKFNSQITTDRNQFAARVEAHLRQAYDVDRFPKRGP